MPTSEPENLTNVANVIVSVRPDSVLDIGVGFGKWGCMVREYADGWCHQRYTPSQWKTTLHGIEIFEGYRSCLWDLYDTIVIGDVVKLIDKPTWALPQTGYDLVIMIDVLEHLSCQGGLWLMEELKKNSKNIVLSYSNVEQSGVCENTHEDHISKWSLNDFPGWGVANLSDTGAVLLWSK